WIFQIARHALVDYYRKNNRRKTVALNDQILMDSVPLEHTIERALTIDQLKSALLGLPEDQREALILRFILGFSISEAADTMRRSEDSIKGLQRRALQTLRVSLAHLE
ncbi:MAG: RNA polymerase sigma factor, partial [Anaerolineales bacterium]